MVSMFWSPFTLFQHLFFFSALAFSPSLSFSPLCSFFSLRAFSSPVCPSSFSLSSLPSFHLDFLSTLPSLSLLMICCGLGWQMNCAPRCRGLALGFVRRNGEDCSRTLSASMRKIVFKGGAPQCIVLSSSFVRCNTGNLVGDDTSAETGADRRDRTNFQHFQLINYCSSSSM